MSIISKAKKAVSKVGKTAVNVVKKTHGAALTVGSLGLLPGKDIAEGTTNVLSGLAHKGAQGLGLEQVKKKTPGAPEVINEDIAGVGADINPLDIPGRDDAVMQRARRKALLMAQARQGRLSTMITNKG